jgi:hypothetical protein
VGEPDRERLRRLTERLDVAAERAERLLSESVRAAATAPDGSPPQSDPAPLHPDDGDAVPPRPPPSGWQRPRADDPRDRDRWLNSDELELLLTVLAGIRDRIPAELRQRLAAAVRELMMALRAVIDWYLERTERPARAGADIEDIPIV